MADRIAGAIVDLCYTKCKNPKVAVEVLLGHGKATVMIESSEDFREVEIEPIVRRLAGDVTLDLHAVRQDALLAGNQEGAVRCGDNGIFRGCAPTYEQKVLTAMAASIYERWPYDGKYIIGRYRHKGNIVPSEDDDRSLAITICQSHATDDEILDWWHRFGNEHLWDLQVSKTFCFGRTKDDKKRYISLTKANPLGPWTGVINVDRGCTNRKLGSDMGDGVSGGGINGKDLSKGDVSINIVAFLKAVQSGQTVTACCSIGDEQVTFQYANGRTEMERFADVVEMARLYILTDCNGSFETFSEWGLIRPKP
jgi:S-adenosylmethionine synthetase